MKKILLTAFSFFVMLAPSVMKGQTFTVAADTVTCNISGLQTCYDNISNLTSGTINIKWRVIGSDFPADWLVDSVLGICDANLCRNNNNSMQLWNGTTGTAFYCNYNSGVGAVNTFDMMMNFTNVTSTGCHWMRMRLEDSAGGYSRNVTFMICRTAVSVPTIAHSANEVLLYPNPANDELNLVYDGNADIKNIGVYNIIGKLVTVYKVSGASANLNLEHMPSGIYFVRLLNSQGNAVATRKFTKQ